LTGQNLQNKKSMLTTRGRGKVGTVLDYPRCVLSIGNEKIGWVWLFNKVDFFSLSCKISHTSALLASVAYLLKLSKLTNQPRKSNFEPFIRLVRN
jgi:hypothetical protein